MPDTRRKILILYASYGDGHIQVSRALTEAFQRSGAYGPAELDLFAEAYPLLNKLAKVIYIKSYTLFPKLYGFSYYATREMGHDSLFSRWFHGWGTRTLRKVLEREKPAAVINTFPMLAMPELRRRLGIAVPIYTVLTDFALHMRWVHDNIDRYYVATDELKQHMLRAGVPAERVLVTGIPLKSGFRRLDRLDSLYSKYGLQPGRKTVLLMAGSYGVLQGLEGLCRTLAADENTQLMIVCGRNEKLFTAMRQFESDTVRVFGFMKEMHELMSLADVMITKPGGITLSEAILCELPLVLLRPVPGQERENAMYLASCGAAKLAYDDVQAVDAVRQLLEGEGAGGQAVQAMRKLNLGQAAGRIVQDMMESLPQIQSALMDGMQCKENV